MTDKIALMREWLVMVATGPAEAWQGKVADNVVIRLPFAPPGVENEIRGIDKAIASLAMVWSSKLRFDWHDVVIRRTEDPELLLTTARSEVDLVSGRHYANSYVMLTRIRDGKIVEHAEYFNPLPVIEAYGKGYSADDKAKSV